MSYNGAKLAADDFGMIQGLVTRLQQETFPLLECLQNFGAYLVTHKGTHKAVTSKNCINTFRMLKR